eukprot:TRINITY_DN14941_c0_g1_i1.p1 TRINITY_DN14941_c0_g1~~TRINITY_DN14941_c0_g1_i1.p1  ORF type:complete len:489 (-),score=135.74 TRINITY_DN14941_c0_g1_i1:72-1538(-)
MSVIHFSCKLETVAGAKSMISLFQTHDNQGAKAQNDEFLMHLEAELPAEKDSKTQEAEFIVVVDRSGSMNGTPWRQVQDGLNKMLDLTRTQGNISTTAIAYNHQTTRVNLTGQAQVDKATIKGIRASGSTNFVAVFKSLSEIFSDKSQDASKAYFVFFMTDGLDTCNNPREIMAEKEKLQTQIEKFGAEVVFHVLGFSEDHDEGFLESLTYLGTSDGTYSFVTPSEGEKALEERLVQLIKSTSSVVGRNINIEIKSENIEFLGDSFAEIKRDVVLPAMMTKQGNTVKIATKKFVRKMDDSEPKFEVKVFEKLTGNPAAKDANISSIEEIVLDMQMDTNDHNLKKLRTALNMITATISDAESENDKEKMKVWHSLVTNKFALLKIDDKTAPKAMVSRKRAVEAGLGICNEIYDPTNDRLNDREKHLKASSAMQAYQMETKSVQNRRQVKKAATNMNSWIGKQKGKRTVMQEKVSATDYALDDFALEDED